MKNLLILILSTLLMASCRINIPMGTKITTHPAPYIKTKDNKTVDVTEMKEKNKKIKADGKDYKKADIIEYSNGQGTFKHIEKTAFAVKHWEGDINVYTLSSEVSSTNFEGVNSSSPTGWKTTSHHVTNIYLQKGDAKELLPLSYKNVVRLIPKNDPGYKYIIKYNDTKKKAKLIKFIGLGIMLAGIAVMAADVSSGVTTLGGVGMLGGLGVFLGGGIKRATNNMNLQKAIGKHNGVYDDDKK